MANVNSTLTPVNADFLDEGWNKIEVGFGSIGWTLPTGFAMSKRPCQAELSLHI